MAAMLVAPLLLQGAAEDELGLAHVHEQCHALLAGMAAQGHSRFELGALCRQRLPHAVCREAMGTLGNQPWSQEAKDATCDRWTAEWQERAMHLAPERRAQTLQDLQSKLDYCTAKKAQLGICENKTMDECVQHKTTEYPKLTQRVSAVLQSMYADYQHSTGMGPAAAASPGSSSSAPTAQKKYDGSQRLDLSSFKALRAISLTMAVSLAAVAAFVWRTHRSLRPAELGLVVDEEEGPYL